jgi:ABC-type lipoprotein release transport system permease subunit
LQGRAPTHADEIAPGEKLLRELHAQLGDRVKLSVADSEFAPPSGRRLRGRDASATARTLVRDYTPEILLDNIPSRMVNLHRVRSLPLLGALLAALFGTVLVAYTLAVGVRRRTRQLGVLRALGMNARRVGRVLVWQGVALSLAIVLIGLPLGVALGTVVWRTLAHSLGVATRAAFPAVLWLLVPAALLVGVLGAVEPAYRARRQHVSELLRAE